MKNISRIGLPAACAALVILTASCGDRVEAPPPPSEVGRFQVIAAPAGQQSVVLFLVDTKEGKSWTYVPPSGPAVNGYWTDIPRVEHPQEFWRQALEQMSSVTGQTGSTATPAAR